MKLSLLIKRRILVRSKDQILYGLCVWADDDKGLWMLQVLEAIAHDQKDQILWFPPGVDAAEDEYDSSQGETIVVDSSPWNTWLQSLAPPSTPADMTTPRATFAFGRVPFS